VNQLTWPLLLSYARSDIENDEYSFSDEDKRLFSDAVTSQTKNTANELETFIMGDFWTGNI
jgi:hypothetical protein